MKQTLIREVRGTELRSDPAGHGEFGAPRGSRLHTGVDFVTTPGAEILAPVAGVVGRIGYAYASDPQYRIVDIHTPDGWRHRCFYIEPMVAEGQEVTRMSVIGRSQDVSKHHKSPQMSCHVHYEVIDPDGNHVNPMEHR